MKRINVNPKIGDAVLSAVESENRCECHVVIIVCAIEHTGKLGQPQFVTSLQPSEMQDLVTQIAGGFALAGKPVIDGIYKGDN